MNDSTLTLPVLHDKRTGDAVIALAEKSFDFLAVVSLPDLEFVHLNDAGRDLLGLSGAPIGGQRLVDYVPVNHLPAIVYEAVPTATAGLTWEGACILRGSSGNEQRLHLFVTGVPNDDGCASTAVVGGADITSLTTAESSLHHEQILLRALLDHLPDAIYFKDIHCRFIRVGTAAAVKNANTTPDKMIGKTDFDFFVAAHAQSSFEAEQRIIRTGQPLIGLEEKETWQDGRVAWASTTKLPLRDLCGKIIGTFGVSRDITARKLAEEEQRRMEAERQQAQKMESIGRLAAGIAHEVNTPTQFINDNTHFLTDASSQITRAIAAFRAVRDKAAAHPDCAEAVRAAAEIERDAELDYLLQELPRTLEQNLDGIARIARIVRSLKEFSHPSAAEWQMVDLQHAIETAVVVSRHEWKYVAELVTEFDPALPQVPCVLDQFNQVLLNLIVNASQAIGDVVRNSGDRGTITIRARCDGPEWVLVEVADTGTGIPVEVQPRIFEPFFTTKEVGKGTGQGLAIVQSFIVKDHHGTVDFVTRPGEGTTFRVRLPVSRAPRPA